MTIIKNTTAIVMLISTMGLGSQAMGKDMWVDIQAAGVEVTVESNTGRNTLGGALHEGTTIGLNETINDEKVRAAVRRYNVRKPTSIRIVEFNLVVNGEKGKASVILWASTDEQDKMSGDIGSNCLSGECESYTISNEIIDDDMNDGMGVIFRIEPTMVNVKPIKRAR